MFKKKYDKLKLWDLFIDDVLQYSLESLPFEKVNHNEKESETIKIKSIPHSIISELLMQNLFEKRVAFGNYIYSRRGNRIERVDVTLPKKERDTSKFKLSNIYKRKVDLDKDKSVKVMSRID